MFLNRDDVNSAKFMLERMQATLHRLNAPLLVSKTLHCRNELLVRLGAHGEAHRSVLAALDFD
jgi:hypothetical protein